MSGALKLITEEGRHLRHDLGGPLNHIALTAELLEAGACTAAEAAAWIRRDMETIRALLPGGRAVYGKRSA